MSGIIDMIKALESLQPGKSLVYARGFLDSRSEAIVALAAWELYEHGMVHLVQRRSGLPFDLMGKVDWRMGIGRVGFEYIAVGATPPYKPIPNDLRRARRITRSPPAGGNDGQTRTTTREQEQAKAERRGPGLRALVRIAVGRS